MNDEIAAKLRDKGLSESSIKLYLSTLRKLNWNAPVENLNYLRKTDEIVRRMDHYACTTRKQMLVSVISVLSLYPKFKTAQNKYYKLVKDWDMATQTPSTNPTETQRKNWLDWDQVCAKFENLKDTALGFEKIPKNKLTAEQYDELLQAVVLGLYVLLPPRRNMDYQKMLVGLPPTEDKSFNYYDQKAKTFTFNAYKTHKTHGTTTESVPPLLFRLLKIYLKFNPVQSKEAPFPLLVFSNGKPFTAVNSITRVLNKIFGKHFGSSMLRHSYLSGKYGQIEQEREEDAKKMGHTVSTQREYIKVL